MNERWRRVVPKWLKQFSVGDKIRTLSHTVYASFEKVSYEVHQPILQVKRNLNTQLHDFKTWGNVNLAQWFNNIRHYTNTYSYGCFCLSVVVVLHGVMGVYQLPVSPWVVVLVHMPLVPTESSLHDTVHVLIPTKLLMQRKMYLPMMDTQLLIQSLICVGCCMLYRHIDYVLIWYGICFVSLMAPTKTPTRSPISPAVKNIMCCGNYIFYCLAARVDWFDVSFGAPVPISTFLGILAMYNIWITQTHTTIDLYMNNIVILHTYLVDPETLNFAIHVGIYWMYWCRMIYNHYHNPTRITLVSMLLLLSASMSTHVVTDVHDVHDVHDFHVVYDVNGIYGTHHVYGTHGTHSIHILLSVLVIDLIVSCMKFINHLRQCVVANKKYSVAYKQHYITNQPYQIIIWLIVSMNLPGRTAGSSHQDHLARYLALVVVYMSTWVNMMHLFVIAFFESTYTVNATVVYCLAKMLTLTWESYTTELHYSILFMQVITFVSGQILKYRTTNNSHMLYGLTLMIVYGLESTVDAHYNIHMKWCLGLMALIDVNATAIMLVAMINGVGGTDGTERLVTLLPIILLLGGVLGIHLYRQRNHGLAIRCLVYWALQRHLDVVDQLGTQLYHYIRVPIYWNGPFNIIGGMDGMDDFIRTIITVMYITLLGISGEV